MKLFTIKITGRLISGRLVQLRASIIVHVNTDRTGYVKYVYPPQLNDAQ